MDQPYPDTRFLLIRHGQARSDDGLYRDDMPLTPLGKEQGRLVAEAVSASVEAKAVYSSTYARAIQTAEPLAARLGKVLIQAKELAEFAIQSTPLVELEGRPDLVIWRTTDRGKDDGETVGEFFQRVWSFCEGLCRRHPNETIVLVTHAGTIDAVFRWGVGISPNEPWQSELELGNGSITEVQVWPKGRAAGGAPRHSLIHRVGDGSHLGSATSPI